MKWTETNNPPIHLTLRIIISYNIHVTLWLIIGSGNEPPSPPVPDVQRLWAVHGGRDPRFHPAGPGQWWRDDSGRLGHCLRLDRRGRQQAGERRGWTTGHCMYMYIYLNTIVCNHDNPCGCVCRKREIGQYVEVHLQISTFCKYNQGMILIKLSSS